jgi:hypothetical protein
MNRKALAALWLGTAAGAAAQPEYTFTLVDAFNPQYPLRECYIWDLSDQGIACGLSTYQYQGPSGPSIGYTGFTWQQNASATLAAISLPRGINNAGLVVGGGAVYDLNTSTMVATIARPTQGVGIMEAMGVNDAGTVVGYAETCVCSNSNHLFQVPFVWDAAGGTRDVPVPGAKELLRINAPGQAVGNIRGQVYSGFSYDVTTGAVVVFSELLPPLSSGPPFTTAMDINDLGQVTGEYAVNGVYRGYVWSGAEGFTVFQGINGAANLSVQPKGINNVGTVVGIGQNDPANPYSQHAVVWDEARGTRDLNTIVEGKPANFILVGATRINEEGWISGIGFWAPWSTSVSFVLKPIGGCYANCDGSTATPALNVADFTCFLQRYAAGAGYANCDRSTTAPVLNVADFTCFLQQYAAGCP